MQNSFTSLFIANSSVLARANAAEGLKALRWGAAIMLALLVLASLPGCASPQAPVSKAVYDFGPALNAPAPSASARRAVLALPELEAASSLDSPAMLYRLQYSDAQQLRPYAQARWSAPPAQLIRQKLRDALSAQGPVVSADSPASHVLRMELDEFSQIFESPERSVGVIRLRASLFRGDQLAAQTVILARANAPSPDAAGGVRALAQATDSAVSQIQAWLQSQMQ